MKRLPLKSQSWVHAGGSLNLNATMHRHLDRRINGSQDITLVYDEENRLTSISGSGINASYVYDGRAYPERSRRGKRVKATVGGVTTVYIGNIYERDNGTTVRKYYYAGTVRVAMRTGGQTYYLLNDHLTSTAITTNASGARLTELRYYAYGGTRYDAGSQMTIYRYTGQRIETGTGLYDYGARWYDPAIGRFLAPDSIVPNPGDSQSLNRYMYVLGNPLRYIDPSGNAPQYPGDPDPNNAACATNWCWQNRWYMAHGYGWSGSGWALGPVGSAVFYDLGILNDLLMEAGLMTDGAWNFGELSLIGQGVVDLMNKIGSASRLDELLGPIPTGIERRTAGSGNCADKVACTFGILIQFYDALFEGSDDFIRGTAVHELAHVIDFNSRITVPGSVGRDNTVFPSLLFPQGTHISNYAVNEGLFEYWSEAVADWVYGGRYKGPYSSGIREWLSPDQADWIGRFLKGWGW